MNHAEQTFLLMMTTLLLAGAATIIWSNPLVGLALAGLGLSALVFTILPWLDGR